jgi:hypothetical protein
MFCPPPSAVCMCRCHIGALYDADLLLLVLVVVCQDARARRSLAHRSHKLRLALLSTAGQLREVKQRDRADRREVRAAAKQTTMQKPEFGGCQSTRQAMAGVRIQHTLPTPKPPPPPPPDVPATHHKCMLC